MSNQLNHNEFKLIQKEFNPNIVLILENLEHEENIGSAFRLADAFNVKKLYIVTNKLLNFKKIEKTARNCTTNIPFEISSSITMVIKAIKETNYTPIAVEICDDSIPLRSCNFAKFNGIALIVGNEKHGVSQTALDNSTFATHIDMYGNNSSINVSTALAIALYKCSEDYYTKIK